MSTRVEPLTEAEKEIAREAFVACLRAAIAAAYSRQVRRGYTRAVMARRLGWTLRKLDRLLLVPRTIKLDEISDVCFAMGCEPAMETIDDRVFISVVSIADRIAAGAPRRLDPKDESAVGQQADAPHPAPTDSTPLAPGSSEGEGEE